MSGDLDAILELGDFPYEAPTSPGDPYFANVVLLMHCDGANAGTTFIDSSSYHHTLTQAGGAETLTVAAKFGSAGMYVNNPFPPGNSDFVNTISAPEFQLTADFTFECFVQATDGASGRYFFTVNGVTTYSLACGYGTQVGGQFSAIFRDLLGASTVVYSGAVSAATYHYVAVTLQGTTLRFFLDGILTDTKTISTNRRTDNAYCYVGYPNFGTGWHGYIDELRLTVGVCRYTTSFSPPTSAFIDSAVVPAVGGGGIVFPSAGSKLSGLGLGTGGVRPEITQSGEVHLYFDPSGIVYWGGQYVSPYPDLPANVNGLTNTFNWIYPNQIDTGDVTAPGASYWIRCVPISGGVPGPTSWTPLTSQVRFTLDNLFAKEVVEAFNIQIASDSNGNNIVCNSTEWTFSSFTVGGMYAGIVNPLVGGTYTTGSLHSARISLSIYKDGTGSVIVTRDESYPQYIYTSLYPFNWYTPNSSNIGSSYWVKITPITGSLSYNNATTVVSLYNGVTCGVLNVSTGGTIASCQFKAEIFFDAAGTVLVSSGLYTFNCQVS